MAVGAVGLIGEGKGRGTKGFPFLHPKPNGYQQKGQILKTRDLRINWKLP